MAFKSGVTVAIKKADLTGTIIKQRLPDEDIYLVHIEAKDRLYREADLELIPDRVSAFPLERGSKEWIEELIHLSHLVVGRNETPANLALEPEIKDSLEKLGIIAKAD